MLGQKSSLSVMLFIASALAAEDATSLAVDEAAIVLEFKSFADQETTRLAPQWQNMGDSFLNDPKGFPIPLSMPRKYMFSGVKLEAAPDTFSIDVRRTDSLVSPYVAYIEWPLVFLKATTHAKGPAEFCHNQPLKVCLAHGGKLIETALLYRKSATRVPQTVKYEYVYQEGQWKPKRSLDQVLAEIVLKLDATQPVSPESAPSILGVPSQPPTPGKQPG